MRILTLILSFIIAVIMQILMYTVCFGIIVLYIPLMIIGTLYNLSMQYKEYMALVFVCVALRAKEKQV